jgi:hypothetical protein
MAILLGGFFAGCGNQTELDNLRMENASLKEEIAKLKETADFHYQTAIDAEKAGRYDEARAQYQVVVEKFPQSALLKEAREHLENMSRIIAAKEQEEKRKAEEAIRGVDVSFRRFKLDPSIYDGKIVNLDCWISSLKKQDYGGLQVKWTVDGDDEGDYFFEGFVIEDSRKKMIEFLTENMTGNTKLGVNLKVLVSHVYEYGKPKYVGTVQRINVRNAFGAYGGKKYTQTIE